MAAVDQRAPSRAVWFALALAVALLAVWRAWVAAGVPLSIDEAYYVAWSKSPDLGYWTKPPMIAWAIGGARAACGESAGCVRMVPVLAFPLSTFLMYALARRLSFTPWQACAAALAFATLPMSAFYGVAATTDGLLLLFWIAAALCLRIALDGQRGAWLAAGLFGGLALLSKYSAGIFALSAALALLHPQWRHWWRSPWPWLAAALAGAVFAPNLWWNLGHGMPTFAHTAEISEHGGYSMNLRAMLEFLLAQFGVGGPVLFGAFIAWLAARRWRDEADGWFLLALGLPFLAVIMLQALLSRANANWAAPAMVAISLAAMSLLLQRPRAWLAASFGINLLLALLLYHFGALVREPFGLPHRVRTDPFWATRNWPGIGEQVREVATRPPVAGFGLRVASDNRAVLAQLQATLALPAGAALGWQRGPVPDNHFEQRFPLPSVPAFPVLLVTAAPAAAVQAAFPGAQAAGSVRSAVVADRPLAYSLWWILPAAPAPRLHDR